MAAALSLVPPPSITHCTLLLSNRQRWENSDPFRVPCGEDLRTGDEQDAGLCRSHLRSMKRAESASRRIGEWTPARHRWLTEVGMGLVTAYVCTVHDVRSTGTRTGVTTEVVAYPRHPQSSAATNWLCEQEVRAYWQRMSGGVNPTDWRAIRLTSVGRRVLAEWDAAHS